MDNRAMEKHTDLAIEVRESFPEDSVEIDGVCLEKHTLAGGELLVTRVIIKDQHGAEQMGKPVGDYFTLEFQSLEAQETIQKEIYKILDCLLPVKDHLSVLVTGLGNRFATPDALGPYVVEHIQVNRHLETDPAVMFSAVIPGVMAQTGIEVVLLTRSNPMCCLSLMLWPPAVCVDYVIRYRLRTPEFRREQVLEIIVFR